MLSQNNSVKYFALFAGLLILIGVGGYVFSIQTSGDATSVVEFNATSSDDVGGAISELLATGATSTTRNGYTVEVVPDTAAEVPPPPSLKRSIPATPDLDESGRAVVVGRIDTSVKALTENPKSFADWMDLGMLRLIVKDYQGAKEAWEYATVLGPNTAVPYGNLGDLYANYLKDYSKAEFNLKQAIANAPRSANYYRQLFELYLVYKPKPNAAEDTLKEAISKFPTQLDHYVLLARYYRDSKRVTEARAAFDQAIAVAEKAGNTQAVTQLKQEKTTLK